jgi:ABC-type amino acid transport substrate-binding protein
MNNLRNNLAIFLAALAIIISVYSLTKRSTSAGPAAAYHEIPGLLEQIDKNGVINAGYGVYPPYTMEDPNTKQVTGFSIDIIEEVAKQLNVKVVWHRLNWNTMSADLKRGSFDIIADPIFQTIPRAREFAFSNPYAYFGDGIAVVKKGDNRFSDFKSLDRKDITVTVGQGWASETFVKNNLKKPVIKSIQTNTDLLQVFNEVISGRADVAIADGADAERFVKEHPQVVKALWLDHPPVLTAAGFALRPNDRRGAAFINVVIQNLQSLGTLKTLSGKYGIKPNGD